MASWNIRTLQDNDNNPERRTAVISKVLKTYNLDFVALSETRIPGNGQLREKDYTFFWVGRPEEEHRTAGVGFAIRNSIVDKLEELPVGTNERLMSLRIPLSKTKNATLISAYAPTMQSSDEVKEEFYEELRHLLKKVPATDSIFLLGDFNARVGNDYKSWPSVLGKHLVGTVNSNGLLLLSLCSEFKLCVTNSIFQQANIYKGTWCHPRSKHWHTLDYVITRQSDRNSLKSTRAHRGSECWSDHRLLRCKLSLSLRRRPRRAKKQMRKKIDVKLLKDPVKRASFTDALDKNVEKCTATEDIETSWRTLRDTIYETSAEHLGFPKRKHQDWFNENDEETSSLIKNMHEAHAKYMSNKSSKTLKKKYHSIKRVVQRKLRSMKEAWWKTKANEMQHAADTHNMKEFYAKLKAVYGPPTKSASPLLSANGKEIIVDENKILERWVEHFSEVLNRDSSANTAVIRSIPQQAPVPELDLVPCLKEVKDASKQLSDGKLPAKDGIPAEIYKAGGTYFLKKLTKLLQEMWKKGIVPQDFKDASVISLFKSGKRSLCDNYRGISLLSVAGKILARIILSRINQHLTDIIYSESQCGFRKGRGTTDMVFCLRQLQEKAREHKSPLFIAFIDLTKAFDTVPRTALWTVLEKIGIPSKMRNIIISLHEGMKAEVIYNGKVSEAFNVNNGTKQGCVLAPLLFALYFAVMLRYALKDKDFGVPVRFRATGGLFNIRRFTAKTKTSVELICDLLFADDCALVSQTFEGLQETVDSFSDACQAFGLTISIKKTEVIYQPPPSSNSSLIASSAILVDRKPLKTTNKFRYLGSTVNDKATLDDEIHFRISKASSAFGKLQDRLWKTHDVSLLTKIKVYRAVVLSSLLYCSETWTPYRRHIKILDAFHMRMLRSICNVSWKDKIPNFEILSRCQIDGIESYLMKSQLRWAGHVVRMDNSRLPKILLYGQLESPMRPMGRPLLRYKDKLKANISTLKLGERSWEDLATSRSEWRSSCFKKIKSFEKERNQQMETDRKNRKCRPEDSTINANFVCDVCNKRCKSKAGLTSHRRSHNQRPTAHHSSNDNLEKACELCSKVCKNSHGLKIHMRVHRR